MTTDTSNTAYHPQPAELAEQQGEAAPSPGVIAGSLRAMVRNYSEGHRWDHLDARMCAAAADRIESLEEALAARQPGAQEPVGDECQCENGGVRYDVRGCSCLKCGKRPQWYMVGRRIRITERRRTNYHPDPDTFEAVCTWHMGGDIEFRKDGETNTRRVNDYRQNLGSVEAIR